MTHRTIRSPSRAALWLALVFLLAWSYDARAEEGQAWQQTGDSFTTRLQIALAAHNGELIHATRLPDAKMGVFSYVDGDWTPLGNYPVSLLNGSDPDLSIRDNTPYLFYENQQKAVVLKLEAGQWVNVGDIIPVASHAAGLRMVIEEDGTIYVAYAEYVEDSFYVLRVKRSVEDGEGGIRWVDVGDARYFADKLQYGSGLIGLTVEDGRVYVNIIHADFEAARYYIPRMFMLDEADGGGWTELDGNTNKLAPDRVYDSNYFSFALVKGVPYAALGQWMSGTKLELKRYQGGEWITLSHALEDVIDAQMAVVEDQLYVAYSEAESEYEVGDWKVWLKRWDDGAWTTVGGGPVLASDTEALRLAELAYDEVEQKWHIAVRGAANRTVLMSIANDLDAAPSPALEADESRAPGEDARLVFHDPDDTWRAAVQYVRNGSNLLTEGVHYELEPGLLTLRGEALHAGVNFISVTAGGFANASTVQIVLPAEPADWRADKVGYGYADLSWTAIDDADSYKITYTADDADVGTDLSVGAAQMNYRLVGLNADTRYSVTIRAVIDGIEGVASEPLSVLPRLVPDELGKTWTPIGSPIRGTDPGIAASGDELWMVVSDDRRISVYREDESGRRLVGPERFARSNGLHFDLELDGDTAYLAYSSLDDGGRMAVVRWDGTSWEKMGGGAFSNASAMKFDMTLYNGTPYVAYSETLGYGNGSRLRVHAYVEDAGGDGVPGWIEIWQEDGIDSGAVQLRRFGDTLYLAYADTSNLYDIRIYTLELAAEAAWQEVPVPAEVSARYWGDLGFDLDAEGNAYVSFDTEVWKHTPDAGSGSWKRLADPHNEMNYADLIVIDGQPFVAFTAYGQEKLHVYKHVHDRWYLVGDTIYAHSGSAYDVSLAEYGGRPMVAFYNGSDHTETYRFEYDMSVITLNKGDGSEPAELIARQGEPLAELAAPVRDDYRFVGWHDGNGNAYDYRTTVIMNDLELFARWKLVTPIGLQVEAGDRSAKLEWSPIGAAANYEVLIGEQPDLSDARSLTAIEHVVEVDGLQNGKMYYLAVRAWHDDVNSERSAAVSVVPMTVPGPPSGVSLEEADGKLTVGFNAPEDDGGSAITQYHIYLDDVRKWSGIGFETVIDGLVNRQSYTVTVTAENAAGESALSAAVTGTPHQVCTVFWLYRDDTAMTEDTMVCGDRIPVPVPDVREGYTFDGWYDLLTGLPVDFHAPLLNAAIIEARWSIRSSELPLQSWNVLNDLSVDRSAMAATSGGGGIYVASLDRTSAFGSSRQAVVSRYDRLNGWQEIGRFSELSSPTEIGIALADNGDLYVLYNEIDLSTFEEWVRVFRRDTASGAWSELFRKEVFAGLHYRMIVDGNRVYVGYTGYSADWTMQQVYVTAYSPAEGLIDLTDGLIGADTLDFAGHSAVMQGGGTLHVAYADSAQQLRVKRRDGTGWTELGMPGAAGKTSFSAPFELVWSEDRPLLFYKGADGAMRLSGWDGDNWQPMPAFGSERSEQAAVYAGEDGLYAIVTHTDEVTAEQRLQLLVYANDSWNLIGDPIVPGGNFATEPRLSVDKYRYYVTYRNGSGAAEMVLRAYEGEPSDNPSDPGDEPDDPGDESGDPGEEPGDPGDEPGDPGDPGEEPGDPGEEPGDPGDDPGDPGDEPGDPGDPGEEPGDPGEDPGDPGEEPGDPGDPGEEPGDPGDPGDEPSNPSNPPTTEPQAPAPSNPDIVVIVNGRPEPIGRVTAGVEGGRSIRIIEVDDRQLAAMLHDAEPGLSLVIPATNEAEVLRGRLNGATVRMLEAKQAVIELQTDRAHYRISAQLLQVDTLLEAFEGSAYEQFEFEITMAEADEAELRLAETAVREAGGMLAANPTVFNVTAYYGEQSVPLTAFLAYVERWIALPDDVDASAVTTAVVVEQDGTLRHVPTRIMRVDGRDYAVVRSMTNSIYALIAYQTAYADIAGHWAEQSVLAMGNRLIAGAESGEHYRPNEAITRADFAAMLVRALGLKPAEDPSGSSVMNGVSASGLQQAEVLTARHYGLLLGFEDGTVRPNDRITREQAITMVARAASLIGQEAADPGNEPLSFLDAGLVSDWAADAVQAIHEARLLYGDEQGRLMPRTALTRAEAAALIHRLLQQAELI